MKITRWCRTALRLVNLAVVIVGVRDAGPAGADAGLRRGVRADAHRRSRAPASVESRGLNVVPFAQRSEPAALAIPKSRADFPAHVVHAQDDPGRVWRISADDADRW